MCPARGPLLDLDVPEGFAYRDDFITAGEEADLAREIANVEFANFEMRGVVARRRVAFFGRSYDAGAARTPPMPAFLFPLREKVAGWSGLAADAFAMALINEYRAGRADRLAPGRAAVRHDRRRLAAVVVPDEAAAVCPPRRGTGRWAPRRDARDHARAAVGVPDDRSIEVRVRAPHPRGARAALLDNLPHTTCSRRWHRALGTLPGSPSAPDDLFSSLCLCAFVVPIAFTCEGRSPKGLRHCGKVSADRPDSRTSCGRPACAA